MTTLPIGRKAFTNKWFFEIKGDHIDDIVGDKTRLLVRSFSQIESVDCQETFITVSKLCTFRMFMAMAARLKLHIYHFDIETAFLYGNLDEETYTLQPDGCNDGINRAFSLNETLYGLKQAPRACSKKVNGVLMKRAFSKWTQIDAYGNVVRRTCL